MTRDEIMNYWIDSAEVDFQAMENLFIHGHYIWALFIGHLVIEKLLKAYHAKNVSISVSPIHDLTKIAEKANLTLSESQKDFLDEVTTFNLKARYPDYKNRFYKKATKEFAETYIIKIKEFRQWLIEKVKR